ncbi:odorant receptor 46a-like [Metopolophium dirhodum]|uniref:odorant receptor 46a-like n=1 Tax=Metopolophium dirhodum TaxID=44670 RepID=UPI0029900239|nr:odorant receptor 46a-like [Metopolophium dirhodum]
MDIRDDQNHVFNVTLAKLIGLYQTLDPSTTKYRGKNVYRIVMAFITLYIGVTGVILTLSGAYYWKNNMPLSVDCYWKGIVSYAMCYSMCLVVHYSNDIWNCLSITCYGLTSNSLRDRHILDGWRERSVLITTILAFVYFMSALIFFVSALALSNDKLPVKNHEGLVRNYRYNLFNLYLFVSEDTYNAHYYMFYIVEGWGVVSLLTSFFVFDVVLVTLCLAITCQLQMICTAFESVGHKSLADHPSSNDCRDEKKELTNKHDLIHDELKTIIMDHQAVMKKYDVFLTLFKRVLLIQMVVFTIAFIITWFCFIMSFSNEERFKSSRTFIVKIFCGIPPNVFKLFATCYLFEKLHNQKDSIVFALYSSNWTEMDMKCKKLILLTMKMNNANHKKLKFTRTKIVSLEMFFKTMRDSYSVLSVLINYIKNMDE